MKITLISQWYTPEPVPFPHDIARELRRRGHKVNVLTGFPNYPSGELYKGYRQRWGHVEHIDGVRVNRQPIFPSHDVSAMGRVANYLSFAASSSLRVHHLRDADVAFVYGTPLTAAFPALLAERTMGVPYVLQIQDLWPDTVTASGMLPNSPLANTIARQIHDLATYSYNRAAAVIGISAEMTRELIARGADPDTTHTIYNWSPHETKIASSPDNSITKIVYAGNLGEMQDLETVVRAARLAEDHCDLQVVIIGDGVMKERLTALASSLGTRSVTFLGRVAPEDMDRYYAEADFSLVTLLDRDVFALTVPSKVQATLARGVPVLTTARGEVSNLSERYQFGLTAAPEDPESLARTMRAAAALGPLSRQQMRRNARSTYQSLFARDSAIARIESILRKALLGNGAT